MSRKITLMIAVLLVFMVFSSVYADQPPKQDNVKLSGKVMIKDKEGKIITFDSGGMNISKFYIYEGELRIKQPVLKVSEVKLTKEKTELKDKTGNYIYFVGSISDKEGKTIHGMIPVWKHAKIWNKDKSQEILLKNVQVIKYY